MFTLIQYLQMIVGVSVFYVWTFRIHNVIREFELFGFNEITRSLVGATKIALSTLLIIGVWYTDLVFIPSVLMSGFMLGAQYYHFKIKDPIIKYVPSFIFLILSLTIAYSTSPN